MKLNKKGFTLVEILAAVAIMGILMGVAVAGVTKYLEKARQESYAAMESSAHAAAQNYIQKHSSVVPASSGITKNSSSAEVSAFLDDTSKYKKISVQTLVDEGFLPKLEDPASKDFTCNGNVYVTKIKGTGSALDTYVYLVQIKCEDYESYHEIQKTNASGELEIEKVPGVIFNS